MRTFPLTTLGTVRAHIWARRILVNAYMQTIKSHGKQRRPSALAAFVFLSLIVLCSMVTRIAPICLQNTASNKDIIDQVDF